MYLSNKELGKEYLGIAGTYSSDITKVTFIKKIIESYPENIEEFFQTNGSLNKLKIKGIGAKTKRILTKIFQNQVEEEIADKLERLKNKQSFRRKNKYSKKVKEVW